MKQGGAMMEEEQKVKEEKLKIQPIPAFVFKIKGKLITTERNTTQQETTQFEQMLNFKKDKNIKEKAFDSSKCP